MKPVKVYAIHYNRPDLIRWQYDSLKGHLLDPFDFTIINNAREDSLRQEIDNVIQELNLGCINTFSTDGLVGKHHANSFNHVWKNHIVHNTQQYSLLIDGDIFLVKDLNVNDLMQGYVFAGPHHKRLPYYHYISPVVLIADVANIPEAETIDWEGIGLHDTGTEVRLDTGGGIYPYYLKHPDIKAKTKNLKSSWHITEQNGNKHCLPDNILPYYNDEYHIEFFNNEFLHYRASSNWDYHTAEHHRLKSEFVKNFVYGTLDGTVIAKDHNYQMNNPEYFGWE